MIVRRSVLAAATGVVLAALLGTGMALPATAATPAGTGTSARAEVRRDTTADLLVQHKARANSAAARVAAAAGPGDITSPDDDAYRVRADVAVANAAAATTTAAAAAAAADAADAAANAARGKTDVVGEAAGDAADASDAADAAAAAPDDVVKANAAALAEDTAVASCNSVFGGPEIAVIAPVVPAV